MRIRIKEIKKSGAERKGNCIDGWMDGFANNQPSTQKGEKAVYVCVYGDVSLLL